MITKLKIISASKCHKWRVCCCNYFRVSYFYNECNIFVREIFFSKFFKKIKNFEMILLIKY